LNAFGAVNHKKKIMTLRYIPFIAYLVVFTSVQAQEREAAINPAYNKPSAVNNGQAIISTPDRNKAKVTTLYTAPPKSPLELIDTLNFPLAGGYALYTNDGGYVSGNNVFNDRAKANVFEHGTQSILKGVLIDFAVATSNNIGIEIAAWNNNGAGGSPGNKIASKFIPLNDIFVDVLNDQTTYIEFENPVLLPPTFYLGVILPAGADTVAIFTNNDGDTSPATAWEQWSTYQWYSYDDDQSWGYEMAHAIFPIVDSEILLTAGFYADPTALMPGESSSFYDLSLGDPVSWEWNFEGGTPGTSNDQNPSVVYETEGLYDVTLIVGDGNAFDTLTREDYVLVTTDIPVETDTLIYPLEGTYVVYQISFNGGYVSGNNVYNDQAMANYFYVNEDIRITGLLIDFAIAMGGNPDISLSVWNNNGTGGTPGSTLASKTVELNTIKSNIANNMLTYVEFDDPVSIGHPFYAGFNLPTAAGDTLVVWSNEDGDTNPGIAWSLWEDGNWVALANPISWDKNFAMGIHPVIEYQTGISDLSGSASIPVFPNPSNGNIAVNLKSYHPVTELEILDLNGVVLKRYAVQAGSMSMMLNLTEFSKGIYFIRAQGANSSGLRKIILH
jgi:PKD repeat protein